MSARSILKQITHPALRAPLPRGDYGVDNRNNKASIHGFYIKETDQKFCAILEITSPLLGGDQGVGKIEYYSDTFDSSSRR